MDPIEREYLNKFYDTNLMIFGDRPEALRWSAEGQRFRYFLMLREAGNLEGASVLDYGCCKGDLYGFMLVHDFGVKYTGMDINTNLIELARSKYPGQSFEVRDVEDTPVEESFDYVFMCGVFNNKVDGVERSMRNVVKSLYGNARRGLIFNVLSSHEKDKAHDLHYTDPHALLDFIKSEITPSVTVIDTAIPGDVMYHLRATPE